MQTIFIGLAFDLFNMAPLPFQNVIRMVLEGRGRRNERERIEGAPIAPSRRGRFYFLRNDAFEADEDGDGLTFFRARMW